MADGSATRIFDRRGPVTIDGFCGSGGASLGMEWGTGYPVTIAVNHDEDAISVHEANHENTRHYRESIWDFPARAATWALHVDAVWVSPECTYFSNARGSRPMQEQSRSLAWVVVDWAHTIRPTVIFLENVQEWEGWGPLDEDDRPIKERKGEYFRQWCRALEDEGYRLEWRKLRSCDYGVPTSRRRLYLIARRDGLPIVWPKPTHGPGLLPYHSAAECIDWDIPVYSMFARSRPYAEATQARIARGLEKYVLDCPDPFIAPVSGSRTDRSHLVAAWLAKHYGGETGQPLDRPLSTVTKVDHHSLCVAYLHQLSHGGRSHRLDEPMRTITSKPKGGDTALVTAWLVNTRNGERRGQAPRVRSVEEPMWTVTSQGSQGALVCAYLVKYYGTGGQWQSLREPLHTVPTKSRFGLVTAVVDGETYAVVDVGMRMLVPRELATASGFPEDYRLVGKTPSSQTIRAQIARIGNAVNPRMAEVLTYANMPPRIHRSSS